MFWPFVAITSIVGSAYLVRFAPQYSLAASYPGTFVFLLSVQLILFSAWSVIIYPKLFSPLRHLPTPSGASFFNGQWATISRDPSGAPMQRWINELPNDGLIYYTNIFNTERLLITSPKGLAEVLVQKSYDFVKPSQIRQSIGRLLGFGILVAEGDEHKLQRKNLMPAFAFRHVKDLYPVFWSKSREMVAAMTLSIRNVQVTTTETPEQAPVLEVADWTSRATLDIIGVAGMGQDFNAIQNPQNELSTNYKNVFQPSGQAQILGLLSIFMPLWFLKALPLKRNDDIVAAATTVRKVCRQAITQRQQDLDAKEKRTEVNIITVALESGGFTPENLVDQMMTFLAAGHETTATAMVWAIYSLCQHRQHQIRLREEIRANLPPLSDDSPTAVTDKSLDRLPFLHAVCNEVLRLHAPVPLTLREAAKDTTILGHFVPKGTKIVLAPWALNTSLELWGPDAATFDPDRWMGAGKTNTGGASSNFANMTFLHGPRSCIGQAFAKAEFACLLAAVVGRFEMVLEDPQMEIEIKGGITARPKGGMPVRMRVLEGW